jgi:hypothetical protein
MTAITTRYYGPTNHRGSRIKASDQEGNTVCIPYPYELSYPETHHAATRMLCKNMGWTGRLAWASLTDSGNVYVWDTNDSIEV